MKFSMRKLLHKKIIQVWVIAVCVLPLKVTAQDVHFSQFTFAPLQVNPALAGIFDGRARISNIYRSQWSSYGKGYSTIYLSADAPLAKGQLKNNYFGIGGLIYQDKAGTAGFKSTIVEGTLSYTTAMDDAGDNYISIGFQAGLNQQALDVTKATWDNQWNGDAFDPSLPSRESIQLQQFSYLNFNAGLLYYYIPDGNNAFNIGAALSHIGSPNVSYFSLSETPMNEKITLHSSADIAINKNYDRWIEPRLLFMMQGKQKELLVGGCIKNKVQFKSKYTNYKKEAYFYGGLFYRMKDAFVVNARFEFNTIGLGLSYDINNSSLSNLAGSANAFEVNLSFVSYVKRGFRSKNNNRMPRFL
jgi:type IX secretion system PorP/SprF family membrane protein